MTPTRADRLRAWGASLALHTLLLLSLAAIVRETSRVPWQPVIETQIATPDPVPAPFTTDIDLKDFLGKGGTPAVGEKIDDLLATGTPMSGSDPSMVLGSMFGQGGRGGQGGTGNGGEGGGMGGEKGLGFFGSKGSGMSVVFVVDMSGSMEGARFARAQQELVKSIHQLHVTQKFFVIFFNKGTVPLFFPRPPRDLVTATPAMKKSATRWIVERRPSSGTEPEEALVLALAMKPEVIYFLTDGEFPERCREVVKERNTAGIIIHTISLQSREGAPLLEAIAADNKGTYKFVK